MLNVKERVSNVFSKVVENIERRQRLRFQEGIYRQEFDVLDSFSKRKSS